MFTRIIFLLLSLVVITSQCFAGDVTFGEAKTAVSGADAQQLEVKDLDGDSKPDLIWRDSSGNLKYSLQANSIPTNGLVAYYPFNGNANDESRNGNNGTVNGATLTTDRHGNANRAYSFDGNDSIVTDTIKIPDQSKPQTLSMWFKTTNANNVAWGGGTRINSVNSRFYIIIKGGKISSSYGNSDQHIETMDKIITDGNWHHAILVSEGNSLSKKLYVDGA
ncbi:hypothetical protein WDW89_13840 [Deltaproteobacteria bacterium TL4]